MYCRGVSQRISPHLGTRRDRLLQGFLLALRGVSSSVELWPHLRRQPCPWKVQPGWTIPAGVDGEVIEVLQQTPNRAKYVLLLLPTMPLLSRVDCIPTGGILIPPDSARAELYPSRSVLLYTGVQVVYGHARA